MCFGGKDDNPVYAPPPAPPETLTQTGPKMRDLDSPNDTKDTPIDDSTKDYKSGTVEDTKSKRSSYQTNSSLIVPTQSAFAPPRAFNTVTSNAPSARASLAIKNSRTSA